MSRPRIFISSTYFDMKHVRSSLEVFVGSLGFDVILSENGKIAYSPDIPLDESCYKEAQASDIFVLLIGGRYGSEASPRNANMPKKFFDRYNSITKKEYHAAREKNIPTYILIEKSVHSEYETYLRNKGNNQIVYAHVDSVNVFELIEDIISQQKNNPIQQFERYSDIENWLREQWSGLFKELLQRMQGQEQIASLQAQVAQLSEINTTLKRYLETIIESVVPNDFRSLIEKEDKRLDEALVERKIVNNELAKLLINFHSISVDKLIEAIRKAKSVSNFFAIISSSSEPDNIKEFNLLTEDKGIKKHLLDDINDMRITLGLTKLNN